MRALSSPSLVLPSCRYPLILNQRLKVAMIISSFKIRMVTELRNLGISLLSPLMSCFRVLCWICYCHYVCPVMSFALLHIETTVDTYQIPLYLYFLLSLISPCTCGYTWSCIVVCLHPDRAPNFSGRQGSQNWPGCEGREPLVLEGIESLIAFFHSDGGTEDWGYKVHIMSGITKSRI